MAALEQKHPVSLLGELGKNLILMHNDNTNNL